MGLRQRPSSNLNARESHQKVVITSQHNIHIMFNLPQMMNLGLRVDIENLILKNLHINAYVAQ